MYSADFKKPQMPIWEYFRKVDNEPGKAECIECDKVLSLGSDKPRHQTVSGLKGHLSTCHKAIYTAYAKRVAEDDGEQAKKKMKVESAATSYKPVTSWTQPTLHTVNERRLEWADDHQITQRIDKCVMDMIIVDMLPYSVVEGDALKKLNFCDPLGPCRYRLKSCTFDFGFGFRPKAGGLFRCNFGFGRKSYPAFGVTFGFGRN